MEDIEQTGAPTGAADDAGTGRSGTSGARLATPVHCGRLSGRSRGPEASTLDPGAIISTVSRMCFPVARPTLALATQAFRDEIVLLGSGCSAGPLRPNAVARVEGEVIAALELYGQAGGWRSLKGSSRRPRL